MTNTACHWCKKCFPPFNSHNGPLNLLPIYCVQLALRLLTARSVQRMMMQLQETDIRLFSWLADFCSKNSPMDDQVWCLRPF